MAGRVGASEIGTRLTGAALRSNHLRRFTDIVETFPVNRQLGTVTRWAHALRGSELALPARHMLDVAPSAVRATAIAVGARGAAFALDGESILDAASTVTGGAIPNVQTIVEEGARMP
jgi:hypothetical protein